MYASATIGATMVHCDCLLLNRTLVHPLEHEAVAPEVAMREPKRKRRGPGPTVGRRPPRARKPLPTSLTLAKLREACGEVLHAWDEQGAFPARDTALQRRREAAINGNLLALYTSLEWCFVDRWGWPGLFDVKDDPPQKKGFVEIPGWLLLVLLGVVWRGIHGKWPRGPRARGRHSTAAGFALDTRAHLGRAFAVLKAREKGTPWEEVFSVASKEAHCAGLGKVSPRTFEASYRYVVRQLRRDPDAFRFLPRFPVPQEWGP